MRKYETDRTERNSGRKNLQSQKAKEKKLFSKATGREKNLDFKPGSQLLTKGKPSYNDNHR